MGLDHRCACCGAELTLTEEGEVICPKCPGEWEDERREEDEVVSG